MSLFVLGSNSTTAIPEVVKEEIIKAYQSGEQILLHDEGNVSVLLMEFLPTDVMCIVDDITQAMSECDHAIGLWDIRKNDISEYIDTLHNMHKYVRIYDMFLNRWC